MKVTVPNTNSGYNLSVINAALQTLANELNNKVLYRDNPVGEPNAMSSDLDMNGRRIYNLPVPSLPSEAARLQDILNSNSGGGNVANLITFLQAGVGAITRTVQAKLEESVSIKDFGAVGDGVTDDTAAIQAALAAAATSRATVYVPPVAAFYLITDTLVIPDYVSVMGDGYNSCIKQTVREKNVFNLNDFCCVSKLRVQGDGVTSGGLEFSKNNGFFLFSTVNSKVLDCFIHGFEFNGIYIENPNNVEISGNTIYDNAYSIDSGSDIVVYSSTDGNRVLITKNFLFSNNSQAVYVNALGKDTGFVIANNFAATLDSNFVTVTSGNLQRRHSFQLGYLGGAVGGRIVCESNFAFNTRETGIYLQGAPQEGSWLVNGNYVRDTGINSIEPGLAGAIYIASQGKADVISNNIVDGHFQTGLFTGGGIVVAPANSGVPAENNTLILGNSIFNVASVGIRVGSNAQNVMVKDNTIAKCVEAYMMYAPDAAFTGGGKISFISNRGYGATKATYGIYINTASTTGILSVEDNEITGFNNTTVNENNAGLFFRNFSVPYIIRRNKVYNYYNGLSTDSYVNTRSPYKIEDNYFNNVAYAYQIGTSSTGLVVTQRDTLINVTGYQASAILAGSRVVYPGLLRFNGTYDIYHNATSSWPSLVGDHITQSVYVVGNFKGLACTAAGDPGTWVSEGNL